MHVKVDVDVKTVVRNLPPPKSVADFKELLLRYGVGPKTLRALSLVAELIFKAPADWNDPAIDPFKFAFAVGGKDGVPYPVDRKVYDELIAILDAIIDKARSDPGIYKYLTHLAKKAESWRSLCASRGRPLEFRRNTSPPSTCWRPLGASTSAGASLG